MNKQDIIESPIWRLFEKGRNYHRRVGIYADTDRNFRMYNGDQWDGAQLGDIQPVQINFIKPIVKYKLSVIHSNLFAIKYSSMNFENRAFRANAERYCEMLNGYAARVWEKDKMDKIGRGVTKDAAINDEGIVYVNFDPETMFPTNERLDKNDVYYGNENDDNIQNQPYILIKKRMAVVNAVDFALDAGLSPEKADWIRGDNDNFEEAGEAAKIELDDMVTVVYKLYKQNGTVHYSVATRFVTIVEDVDLGIKLYPVAHYTWEEKKGSARGEGEVRGYIPNQIEVNKTEMRRVLTVKYQAFPQKVVDVNKVQNPAALNTVGSVIKVNNATVDDVHKAVGTLPPAQMSTDVKTLVDDLVSITRELAGAGEAATGQVNPESASGRAILAVQQASQAPMTEQTEAYKDFLEDLAKIWLDYLIAYSKNGVKLEVKTTDETGKEMIQLERVPQSALEQLQASVKIDVTPKTPFDKFAQEMTIENLMNQGYFNVQRLPELKAYVNALDDDSVAPKMKLMQIIEYMEAEQRKIAEIEARTQMMLQNASQFLNGDPDAQASQIAGARQQLAAQAAQKEQV